MPQVWLKYTAYSEGGFWHLWMQSMQQHSRSMAPCEVAFTAIWTENMPAMKRMDLGNIDYSPYN